MPKIGTYEFPLLDIDTVEKYLRELGKVVRAGEEIGVDEAADAMKVHGGRFNTAIASLEYYGLADRSRGKIVITELGDRLAHPDPGEAGKVKSGIIQGSNIFRDIFEQYGLSPAEEQIRILLRRKGDVERKEAEKQAINVLKTYKKVAKYFSTAEKPKKPIFGEGIGRREAIMVDVFDAKVDDVYLQLPKTLGAIRRAKRLLDILEEEVRETKPKKEKEVRPQEKK